MIGRSWAEVNVQTLVRNYEICKSALPLSVEPMAVVKADAYGHGDIPVARALQAAGCQNFAVSNLEEGQRLREAGIEGQILILGYTPVQKREELKQNCLTQALLSEEYAEALAGGGLKAQFAIDTGMNRIGLDGDDPAQCETIIRRYAGSFELTGLFTHFCVADCEAGRDFTRGQMEKFEDVAARVADLKLPYIHCLNSAASLGHRPFGNLARLGIVLYGLKPDDAFVLPEGIKPALTWKTAVSLVKTLHAGESVGYGRSFTAEHEMRIATLSTGYADGYSRALSNRGKVLIKGRFAPVVGRVCMDQMMVDVSDIGDVRFGDEAILCGSEYTPDDMARDIGTIGYEVVCGISKRVPRVYTKP